MQEKLLSESERQGPRADEKGSGSLETEEQIDWWEAVQSTAFQQYMTDRHREMLLVTHAQAKQPGLLIDFGAGHGRWTKFFVEKGWRAICMDTDAQVLGRCQKANPTATCIQCGPDLRRFPAEDGEVRLILCIGVYGILESDWFLDEARRVLEPNGLVYASFFNKVSVRGLYRNLMDRLGRATDFGKGAYQASYAAWRRRARREGLDVINEEGLSWLPVSCESNSPLVGIFSGLERLCGLRRLPSLSPWVNFLAIKR